MSRGWKRRSEKTGRKRMTDFSKLPARVSRSKAMELLSIEDERVFAKVVDANPSLKHKIKGEKRCKYLTAEIARLLKPSSSPVHKSPTINQA